MAYQNESPLSPATYEATQRVISLDNSLYKTVILTSSVALLFAYSAFVYNDRIAYERELSTYASMLAQVVAENSVAAMSFRENDAANSVLQSLEPFRPIRHAVLLTNTMAPFVEYRRDWNDVSRARIVRNGEQYSDQYIEISRPIFLDNKIIGYVYLLVGLEGKKTRLYRFTAIGAMIMVLSLTGALLVSKRIIQTASEPIFRLVELAEKVGRDRDYSLKAEYSSIREINTLVFSFNNMLSAIHERDQSLIENEQKLTQLANYDLLTNLPNRAMFIDRLDQAIRAAKRDSSLVCVLFIDLDRFKHVNDTLGHKYGDALLLEAARRLKDSVRDSDTVARYAGDEFTAILQRYERELNAEIVASRMLASLRASYVIYGRELHISASIGISVYPNDANDRDTLLHHADSAMYLAKNRGRNLFEFYDPVIHAEADRRNRIEADLTVAIENNSLELFYQPIVDAKTLRISGVEALLRWQHPEFGWLSPTEFVAIAESSGIIKPLGEWVLRMACRQLHYWHEAGHNELTMAINVSTRQFHLSDFMLDVAAILLEESTPVQFVELELTESIVMHDPEKVMLMLQAIKSIGVSLSIDDFGTGYSSLSYLQRFPIDSLKIDRSFVRGIGIHKYGSDITLAIISMAHNLNLKVIAEGIETVEQLKFLQHNNCDQVQGYYFSHPLSVEEMNNLLSSPNFDQ